MCSSSSQQHQLSPHTPSHYSPHTAVTIPPQQSGSGLPTRKLESAVRRTRLASHPSQPSTAQLCSETGQGSVVSTRTEGLAVSRAATSSLRIPDSWSELDPCKVPTSPRPSEIQDRRQTVSQVQNVLFVLWELPRPIYDCVLTGRSLAEIAADGTNSLEPVLANAKDIINRPGVAGAVLQKPFALIHPVILFLLWVCEKSVIAL